jgi:Protein of unknown function (DUF3667)
MEDTKNIHVCKTCGFSGAGDYCSHCGQPYQTRRITLSSLLHDVLHFFTHFEKGFPYTLKQLVIAPGHMQRTFLEGDRARHQKPFSMFFICATLVAVSRYWILKALYNNYQAGDIPELNFVHEYMVVLYISLMPVYTLIAWLLFYKSGYNYAEMGVLLLYTISFFFLISTLIFLFKFAWPHIDTAYIEFPVYAVYFVITQLNFFKRSPRWEVLAKSLISITIVFFLNQLIEDFVVRLVS